MGLISESLKFIFQGKRLINQKAAQLEEKRLERYRHYRESICLDPVSPGFKQEKEYESVMEQLRGFAEKIGAVSFDDLKTLKDSLKELGDAVDEFSREMKEDKE